MTFIRKKTIKGRTYYYEVENTRVGNKTTQKVLRYLGTADALAEAKKLTIPDEAIKNIDVHDIVSFGLPVALLAVAEKLNLANIINEYIPKGGGINPGLSTVLLAINRIDAPTCKSGVQHWYERTALKDIVPMSPDKLSCQNLCHLLDYLTPKRIMDIELALVNWYTQEFNISKDCFIYDITSTYTFGNIKGLSAHGYSRDHRPDLEQVNIGLVVTRHAFFPVLHFVFEGNVTDVTTLPNTAQMFKQVVKDSPLTLVYDRGMLSEENLMTLDKTTPYDYICGLKFGATAVKDIVVEQAKTGIWELLKAPDAEHCVYGSEVVTELYGKKRKIVVCYSEDMALTERTNRDRNIDESMKELGLLQKRTTERRFAHDMLVIALHKILEGSKRYFRVRIIDEGKGYTFKFKKHKDAEILDQRLFRWTDENLEQLRKATEDEPLSKDDLEKEIEEILKAVRVHYRITYLKVKQRSSFTFEKKDSVIEEARSVDGLYALMSTKLDVRMDEVMDVYDCKDGVEKAFYTIKHPISIQPIRHWNPQRVQGHIFVCVLGYLLWATMRYLLKTKGYEHRISSAMLALRDVRAYHVRFKNSDKDYRGLAGQGSDEERILELVGAKKYVTQYLNS